MPVRLWSIMITASFQIAALRSCTALEQWQWQSEAIANPRPYCYVWGDQRGLSPQQEQTIRHLAWPQSYPSILNALGAPDCRHEDWDLYKLPSGGVAKIHYSGAIATTITITDIP